MGIMITVSTAMNQVALYNTLSTVFLVTGILFTLLSVTLFFLFRVGNILAVKTGRAQRRTIREMESINAETGRLQRAKRNVSSGSSAAGQMWNTSQLDVEMPEGRVETGVMSMGTNDTTILNAGSSDTTVLSPYTMGLGDTSALSDDAAVPIGKFVITREIVMIHTEEAV